MAPKKIVSDSHLCTLGRGLWELQKNQVTTDAWLFCTEELVPVHRAVLAACSPYFKHVVAAVAGTGAQPVVVLPRADPNLMKKLLEFMYVGNLTVEETELDGVESLAKYFKMPDLCEALKRAQEIFRTDSESVPTPTATGAGPGPKSSGRRRGSLTAPPASACASSASPAASFAIAAPKKEPVRKKGKMRGPKRARKQAGMVDDDDDDDDDGDDDVKNVVEDVNGGESGSGSRTEKRRRTVSAKEPDREVGTDDDQDQAAAEEVDSEDISDGVEEVCVDGVAVVPPKGLLKPPAGRLERLGWCSWVGVGVGAGTKSSPSPGRARSQRQKQFFCSFPGCGFVCKLRVGINGHERDHSGDATYFCPHCVWGFDDVDDLRQHVLLRHNEDAKSREERERAERKREQMAADDDDDGEEEAGTDEESEDKKRNDDDDDDVREGDEEEDVLNGGGDEDEDDPMNSSSEVTVDVSAGGDAGGGGTAFDRLFSGDDGHTVD